MALRIPNIWLTDASTNREIRKECCGCSACSQKCPKNAITMEYDNEGFLYPRVNEALCVNCGLCANVCPIINANGCSIPYLKCFAGYTKDEHLLSKCTSGGFVTALSMKIIEDGGEVAGVRYSEDIAKSEYHIATTQDELWELCGSKYVQSEKKDIFKQIEELLKNDKKVLFVGCPCDVSAILGYLKYNYSKLLTVELVCMGVSSYRIAEEYKNYVENKYHDKLVSINARSKAKGWFVPHLEEVYGTSRRTRCNTLFGTYLGYGMQVYNRPSCFACQFRGTNGVGDIRVGDFWGIKETDDFWNPNGVSGIYVRSEKGLEALKLLSKKDFALFEVDYDTATQSNMSSLHNKSEKYIQKRETFSKILKKEGLIQACIATGTVSFWARHLIPDRYHAGIKKMYHKVVDKR